jgi:hypothetical protein
VGCSARKNKCPALTFFTVKREDKEWQRKLVLAINRCDTNFNENTACICSRHFADECLVIDGKCHCSIYLVISAIK